KPGAERGSPATGCDPRADPEHLDRREYPGRVRQGHMAVVVEEQDGEADEADLWREQQRAPPTERPHPPVSQRLECARRRHLLDTARSLADERRGEQRSRDVGYAERD